MSTNTEIAKAKYAYEKVERNWTRDVMDVFSSFGLDRHAEAHRDFFSEIYWGGPSNSSLKINEGFARRVAALKAKTTHEPYLKVIETMEPLVQKIVEASKVVEAAKAAKLAAKNAPKLVKVVNAMVPGARPAHGHKLVKVVRTLVTGRGFKFVGHFADGTVSMVRRAANRPYTLAVVRHFPVNGNMKDKNITPGSYVSLHTVAPKGEFSQIVSVTIE